MNPLKEHSNQSMASDSTASQGDPPPRRSRWRVAWLIPAILITVAVIGSIPGTPPDDRMSLLGIGGALIGVAMIGYARASGAWWFWGIFGLLPGLGMVMAMLGVAGELMLAKRGWSGPTVRGFLAFVLVTLLSIWALVFTTR